MQNFEFDGDVVDWKGGSCAGGLLAVLDQFVFIQLVWPPLKTKLSQP